MDAYLDAQHLLRGAKELLDVPYNPLLVSVVLRRLHGTEEKRDVILVSKTCATTMYPLRHASTHSLQI